jgi:hypothetical protein
MKKIIIFIVLLFLYSGVVNAEGMFPGLNKKIEHHSLGTTIKSEISIKNILREANLDFKVEDALPNDGTPRRIITAKKTGAILNINGRPDVISSFVIIVPTDDNIVNLNSLLVMGAALDTFCTHNSSDGGKLFLQKYSNFISSNKLKCNGIVGKCKYEMIQSEKKAKSQLFIVTFEPKN